MRQEKNNPPVAAHLLYPDGRLRLVLPADGVAFSLAELQEAVGGLIEVIDMPDEWHYMVIRETGKLDGLPRNEQATRLVDLWPDDYIAGPALVCLASQVR